MQGEFKHKGEKWEVMIFPDRIELYLDVNGTRTWIDDIDFTECRTLDAGIAIAKGEINNFKQYRKV